MDRLTGIGVSSGIAVGRAVILTQRTEVMRFPIPPDRVEREVQALHAGSCATSLRVSRRAPPASSPRCSTRRC